MGKGGKKSKQNKQSDKKQGGKKDKEQQPNKKDKSKPDKKSEVIIKEAIAAKKQDRLTKRELKRRKNMKYDNEWKEDLIKFGAQLAEFGLRIKIVKGDGNCLFRSLSDQIEGNENNYMEYRKNVVGFIMENREYFEPFIEDDEKFDDYIEDMKKDAVWAGNLEIQGFSMLYKRNVVVHIVNQPSYVISFSPEARTVHCSYHLGVIILYGNRNTITALDGKMI